MATPAQSKALDSWPSVQDAAAQLETSVRTIWRYGKDGAIRTAKRPRAGKKPEIVCHPEDIERLRRPAAGEEAAHVMTEQAAALTLKRRPGRAVAKPWEGALEAIATILTAQRDTARLSQKLWLTLDEAAAYSGLAKSDLLLLCRSARIEARKSGGWKIRRASLDVFSGG